MIVAGRTTAAGRRGAQEVVAEHIEVEVEAADAVANHTGIINADHAVSLRQAGKRSLPPCSLKEETDV